MGNLKLPRINRVCLSGRLTHDPEVKTVGSGSLCYELNMAFDDGFGDRKETSYVHITAWDKVAERAEKQGLHKGSAVYVEGKLKQEWWEDRDGKKQSKTRITAWQIDALEWPDGDAGAQTQGAATASEDDTPF